MKTFTFLSNAFILRATQWFRCWRQLLILPLFLVAITLTSNIANAQTPYIEGVAPMITPDKGLGIDGDVYANYGLLLDQSANKFGDWIWDDALYPGPGRGVLANTVMALPLNNDTTFRIVDLVGNADLNGYYT